jgi:hypothetical protein
MRWKPYISAIISILALRFLDLYFTYRYTPNLTNEWNPIVSLFNMSWPGFIVIQFCIVIFVSLLMFFYFNRETVEDIQNDLSFNDFVYFYFFGKLRPWPHRIFSVPTNLKRHLVFDGFVFMVVTITVSIFAIIHNLLLVERVELYIGFVSRYHKIYFPICFILPTLISAYLFFGNEYNQYRRITSFSFNRL